MNVPSIVHRGWAWTRNQDLVVLVLSFTVVAGAWLFIALAGEMRAGGTEKIDGAILRWFRNPNDPSQPIGKRFVQEGVRDLTALGSMTVLGFASAIVGGFLLLTRKYAAFLLLGAALGGGLALNKALKLFFSRPRPEYVNPLHHVDSYSFPSGHALLATVVYLTLGALLARFVATRPLRIYVVSTAVLLAFIVGLSRVYLGVHYPSDVLAGWTVGLLWAIICWLTARTLQQRGAVERPAARPKGTLR
jgi:undecaprenyl-diphosphatase